MGEPFAKDAARRMRKELTDLEADQDKATCWGAAVGERGKRIAALVDALRRELARQTDTPNNTDASAEAVERPCPNCGVTLNGHFGLRRMGARVTHDRAYCMRYLRDSRDTLAAERDALKAKLDEAEGVMESIANRLDMEWSYSAGDMARSYIAKLKGEIDE